MTVQLTIGCGSSEITDPARPYYHRRAWLGGSSARAWASVVRDGQREVVSISQGGSRCNPVGYEPALSGAVHAFATLGSGYVDPAGVAEAVRLAWVGLGAAASRVGAVVTIPGASLPLVGGAPDLDAEGFRGRWGNLRYFIGDVGEQTGPVNGTGLVRLVMPAFAGRVIGLGCVGSSGFRPRLAIGRGGPFASPGSITEIREGRMASALNDYATGVVVLDDPLSFSAGEALWMLSCEDGTGTQAYRLHSDGVNRGTLTAGENFLLDTTRATPGTPFGSTYTPNVTNDYPLYGAMFVIVECAPYRADGRLQPSWIGTVRAATGGSPSTVVLANESVHFRHLAPSFQRVRATRARLSVGARSALEGYGVHFYRWLSTAIPAVSGDDLLGAMTRMDPAAPNAYAETTGVVELGEEVIGTGQIISLGFNFGLRDSGGAGSVTEFVFDPPGAFPSRWLGGWPDDDDGSIHSDWMEDGFGVLSEYRTRQAAGSTMPENDPNASMPATFVPNASDDGPTNAARTAYLLESSDPGWSALAIADGGAASNLALLCPEVLDD